MANTNAPNGFVYAGRMDGGSPTMGNTTRKILSTYNVAIGFGDPVISVASGYIQRATASTVQIAGIFMGCSYLNTAVGRVVWANNWPGTAQGSDAVAYLNTDPQSLFIAQSNNTAIAFADIDANIQFVIGEPNSVTGISTTALDQSTIATTDTLPFRIVGLASDLFTTSGPGCDNASAYNRVIVAPNYWDRKSLLGIV
jgi:hypothetical protein